MVRSFRLNVEVLEDRLAPAQYGIPWPNPQQLTLSFVPDGTLVDGAPSVLCKTLDALEMQQHPGISPAQATQLWQSAILQAFQTWAINANINIGLVSDDGEPLGTAGPPQGDPNFGDIRISMVPLSSTTNGALVAFSQPYSPLAGTWSGDVELNACFFKPASTYDIFSVMLHEAGHVFGFADESTDPSSIMYQSYQGLTSLSSGDIAAFQALYGLPSLDTAAGTVTTITPGSASKVDSTKGLLAMDGDLTASGDVDTYQYQVTGGKGGGNVTFTLHTSGLSLLVPELTVYDSKGNVVATEVDQSPLDSDLASVSINAKPGATYTIKVQAAPGLAGTPDSVFGIGSYQLEVNTGATSNGGGNSKGNNSQAPVINLQAHAYRSGGLFDYGVQGNLATASQVDLYSFMSPSPTNGLPTVMNITVWGTQPGGLQPQLVLEDNHGNVIPVQVLVNQDGTYSIQLPNTPANTTYHLAVQAENPNGSINNQGYYLAIEFGTVPVQLDTIVAGQTLTTANPQQTDTLHILQTQLLHLVFTAADGTAQLTLTDAKGNVVGTLSAGGGQTVTANYVLNPGIYTVTVTGTPGVTYAIQDLEVSDAIGPEAIDTTLDPGPTTTTGLQYWWQSGVSAFLGLLPPPAGSLNSGTVAGGNSTPGAGNLPSTSGSTTPAITGGTTGNATDGNSPSGQPFVGPTISTGPGSTLSTTTTISGSGNTSGAGGSFSIWTGTVNGVTTGSLSGSGSFSASGAAADGRGLATIPSTVAGGFLPGTAGPSTLGSDGPTNPSGVIVALNWVNDINSGFGPFLRSLAPPAETATVSLPEFLPVRGTPETVLVQPAQPPVLPPLDAFAAQRAEWFASEAKAAPAALELPRLGIYLLLAVAAYPIIWQLGVGQDDPDRDRNLPSEFPR